MKYYGYVLKVYIAMTMAGVKREGVAFQALLQHTNLVAQESQSFASNHADTRLESVTQFSKLVQLLRGNFGLITNGL